MRVWTIAILNVHAESVMKTVAAVALLCLVACASAISSQVLRVPLTKRVLTAEQVQASQTALRQYNLGVWSNQLRGEPQEADIPLLDFLDAQCMLRLPFAVSERYALRIACIHQWKESKCGVTFAEADV